MSNLFSLVDKLRSFPPTKDVMFDAGFVTRLDTLQFRLFSSKPKLKMVLPDDYLDSIDIFVRARLIIYLYLTIQCESKMFSISSQSIPHIDSLIFSIVRKHKSDSVSLISIPCVYPGSVKIEDFSYTDQGYLTTWIEEWMWMQCQTADPVEILFYQYKTRSEKILCVYLVGEYLDKYESIFKKLPSRVQSTWEKWIYSDNREKFRQRLNI